MKSPDHAPPDAPEVEDKRDVRRVNQPYAAELDERELEQAHHERRPIDPEGRADKSKPDDLPAFVAKTVEVRAQRRAEAWPP